MERVPPIKCIFFSEFHTTAGPIITYQVPEDYLSKEAFDTVHVYIITKPQLQNRLITINALGHKIMGCPVCIENPKYPRNMLIFNLCLVIDATASTAPFEIIVKKLAGYLTNLELENEFLSNEEQKSTLPNIMSRILSELNMSGTCNIPINKSNTIHLKLVLPHEDASEVADHDVPIFLCSKNNFQRNQWDLTTQQIIPYIDGFNHVARISVETDVEINLVKGCVQNLLHFNIIAIISIFQYSNVYTVTPEINRLAEDKQMQESCIKYVAKSGRHRPSFHNVFMLYCGLTPGTTVRDLCTRFNPHTLKIDERKLIQFGMMKKLIRRLHKYPLKLPNESGSNKTKHLYKWFTGRHHYDDICCKTGLSYQELDDRVESDPSVVTCWK